MLGHWEHPRWRLRFGERSISPEGSSSKERGKRVSAWTGIRVQIHVEGAGRGDKLMDAHRATDGRVADSAIFQSHFGNSLWETYNRTYERRPLYSSQHSSSDHNSFSHLPLSRPLAPCSIVGTKKMPRRSGNRTHQGPSDEELNFKFLRD